jgi:hypothetical protein
VLVETSQSLRHIFKNTVIGVFFVVVRSAGVSAVAEYPVSTFWSGVILKELFFCFGQSNTKSNDRKTQ